MLAILKAHSLEFYVFAAVAVTLNGISKSRFFVGFGAITVAIIAVYVTPLKSRSNNVTQFECDGVVGP
ncbi:MAG: hypothetical protein QMB78_01060, partial [Rhodospirillales bacterium]